MRELEDLRFDHEGCTFAIFRNFEGEFFRTERPCPHETVHLAAGRVVENTVGCPKHASIFDFITGEVEPPPAWEDLRTCPARIENGRVTVYT